MRESAVIVPTYLGNVHCYTVHFKKKNMSDFAIETSGLCYYIEYLYAHHALMHYSLLQALNLTNAHALIIGTYVCTYAYKRIDVGICGVKKTLSVHVAIPKS